MKPVQVDRQSYQSRNTIIHPMRVRLPAIPITVLLVAFTGAGIAAAQAKRPPAKAGAAKAPAPSPAPKREQAVPFVAGEVLTYDISWSSFLTAGSATVTVKEKKPSYGSTAYYIVAEGRPTPLLSKMYSLYYKADTLLDVYTLLPQRGSVYSDERGRHRMRTTLFDQGKHTAEYEVQTATLVKKSLSVPSFVQDALSALYVIRAIGLKPGDKVTMPIADNGQSFKLQLQATAVESVKTGSGMVQALKVIPTVVGNGPAMRSTTIWLSTDARRLPVRLESDLPVGRFVLVLRQG
jgi:hypothetical protein